MSKGYINTEIAESMFKGSDFTSEKDFCEYIEHNMAQFCIDCLGVELDSYKKEFVIQTNGVRGRRKNGTKRIDYYIKSKCGKYIGIECKHPTYAHSDLSNAVGQVLSYISIFKAYGIKLDKIYLVSSKCDWIIPQLVKDFNLPIEFVCIKKGQIISMDTNLLFEN